MLVEREVSCQLSLLDESGQSGILEMEISKGILEGKQNLQQIVKALNPLIHGWGNYQRRGNVKMLYGRLDEWIRMRLRAFMEKKKAVPVHTRTAAYPTGRWRSRACCP